jgi:SAM-dependent methyltransferase
MLKVLTKTKKMARYFGLYLNFVRQWNSFKKITSTKTDNRFLLDWSHRVAALWENSSTTSFDAHYVYHNAWALRKVIDAGVKKHVDISSTLYFCTTLSATVPVEFYDYRPARLKLSNLKSDRADLTRLPFPDSSLSSLSCMHTVEHIGLGRYGDPLDPLGDEKAIAELKRVVEPGGLLIIVLPVGIRRLCFNAHRIYDFLQVCSYFKDFTLKESALVTDAGDFIENPKAELFDLQQYGCGCFLFQKNV